MRRYIIASHHKLAYGLKDTVDFLTNGIKKIYDVNAYVEDGEKPIEEVVSELFASFDENDEVLVFADMMGGRKITIFVPRKLTQDNKERYRVVKGEVAAIYSKMVHVCVKAGRSTYNECFLKTDLYRWQFNVK